jgi:HK97 family phage major capsid protein/HK97 family phage prohead protease
MNRAYSLIEVKNLDEDKRIFSGWATTPEVDRVNDTINPLGAVFRNPLTLLHQHNSAAPIGTVRFKKPTKSGIEFEAEIPVIKEPGPLKDRVDTAWGEIKNKLIRAVSVGFRPLKYAFKEDGGIDFQEIEIFELSTVSIPANAGALILDVKSIIEFDTHAIDSEQRAASGNSGSDSTKAGASASRKLVVKAEEAKMTKKSFAEQIAAFEETRQVKSDRMDEILAKAGEEVETLDAAESEEYDRLEAEVTTIDEHLRRLTAREEVNKSAAKAVEGTTSKNGSESRGRVFASPKRDIAKGTAFVRMVGALAGARGNRMEAAEFAKRWRDSTPEVEAVLRTPADVIEKAAVAVGTTTDSEWAEPLVQYQNMAGEFIEFLRPMTIIGRMSGFRNVPFKIKVPRQTGGATVNWVGEAKVKPLSALAFDSVTLEHTKIAGIIPLSEELVRFSSPSAEQLVRADLAGAIVQFMDAEFIDPTKAVSDVSPASITNGVAAIPASGLTAAAFRVDVRNMFAAFLAASIPVSTGHWIMTQTQALAFSLMQNALGQPEFPGVTMQGGSLLGFPVVASENVPATGGSPADGSPIIFAVAGEILLADDGGVSIDMSREASLQMESTPDSPAVAGTVLVSLWQHNMVAIKAERFINWVKRRSTAVGYISFAKYAE